ncbi:MAG: hypothetical protein RBR02_06410 [Desulfuromonadaceae bacterium]|nr:hypothetical protein [Desulfuromonadaceae bacterium]
MAINVQKKYFNTEEYLYDTVKTSSYFDEQAFKTAGADHLKLVASLSGETSELYDENTYKYLPTEYKNDYLVNAFYNEDLENAHANLQQFKDLAEQNKNLEIFNSLGKFEKFVYSAGLTTLNAVVNATVGTVEGLIDLGALAVNVVTGATETIADWIYDPSKIGTFSKGADLGEFIAQDTTGIAKFNQEMRTIYEKYTYIDKNFAWKVADMVVSGIAQMTPIIATGGASAGIKAAGSAVYWGSMAGRSSEELYRTAPDASWLKAGAYTAAQFGVEYMSEKMFGDVIFGDGFINFTNFKNSGWVKRVFSEFTTEGIEEAVSEFGSALINKYMLNQEFTDKTLEDIGYAFIVGGMIGGIMSGAKIATTTPLEGMTRNQTLGYGDYKAQLEDISRNSEINKLQRKYSKESKQQIQQNHAEEYQKAVYKDNQTVQNLFRVQAVMMNVQKELGDEGLASVMEIVDSTFNSQREGLLKYTATQDFTNIPVESIKDIAKSNTKRNTKFIPKINENSTFLNAKDLLKKNYGITLVGGDFVNKKGAVNEKGVLLSERTMLISNKLFETESLEFIQEQVIKEELIHRLQVLGGVELKTGIKNLKDALYRYSKKPFVGDPAVEEDVRKLYGKESKVTIDAEIQAKTLMNNILFDDFTIDVMFGNQKKLGFMLFNKIKNIAKTISLSSNFGKIRYRTLNNILNKYRTAAVSNSSDVVYLAKMLNESEERIKEEYQKIQSKYNLSHFVNTRFETPEEVQTLIKAEEFLLSQTLDTVDLNWDRIYDEDYYSEEFVKLVYNSNTEDLPFEDKLIDYMASKYFVILNQANRAMFKTIDLNKHIKKEVLVDLKNMYDSIQNLEYTTDENYEKRPVFPREKIQILNEYGNKDFERLYSRGLISERTYAILTNNVAYFEEYKPFLPIKNTSTEAVRLSNIFVDKYKDDTSLYLSSIFDDILTNKVKTFNDTEIQFIYDKESDNAGNYNSIDDIITINIGILLNKYHTFESFINTLFHETVHSIAKSQGLSQGSSPTMIFKALQDTKNEDAYLTLRDLFMINADLYTTFRREVFAGFFDDIDLVKEIKYMSRFIYDRTLGEMEANDLGGKYVSAGSYFNDSWYNAEDGWLRGQGAFKGIDIYLGEAYVASQKVIDTKPQTANDLITKYNLTDETQMEKYDLSLRFQEILKLKGELNDTDIAELINTDAITNTPNAFQTEFLKMVNPNTKYKSVKDIDTDVMLRVSKLIYRNSKLYDTYSELLASTSISESTLRMYMLNNVTDFNSNPSEEYISSPLTTVDKDILRNIKSQLTSTKFKKKIFTDLTDKTLEDSNIEETITATEQGQVETELIQQIEGDIIEEAPEIESIEFDKVSDYFVKNVFLRDTFGEKIKTNDYRALYNSRRRWFDKDSKTGKLSEEAQVQKARFEKQTYEGAWADLRKNFITPLVNNAKPEVVKTIESKKQPVSDAVRAVSEEQVEQLSIKEIEQKIEKNESIEKEIYLLPFDNTRTKRIEQKLKEQKEGLKQEVIDKIILDYKDNISIGDKEVTLEEFTEQPEKEKTQIIINRNLSVATGNEIADDLTKTIKIKDAETDREIVRLDENYEVILTSLAISESMLDLQNKIERFVNKDNVANIVNALSRANGTINMARQLIVINAIYDMALNNTIIIGNKNINALAEKIAIESSAAGSLLNATRIYLQELNSLTSLKRSLKKDHNIDDYVFEIKDASSNKEIMDNLKLFFGEEFELESKDITEGTLQKLLQIAKTEKNYAAVAYLNSLVQEHVMSVISTMSDRNEILKFLDKVKAWRYFSLLSKPSTWFKNIVVNLTKAPLQKATDRLSNFIFNTFAEEPEYRVEKLPKGNVLPDKPEVNVLYEYDNGLQYLWDASERKFVFYEKQISKTVTDKELIDKYGKEKVDAINNKIKLLFAEWNVKDRAENDNRGSKFGKKEASAIYQDTMRELNSKWFKSIPVIKQWAKLESFFLETLDNTFIVPEVIRNLQLEIKSRFITEDGTLREISDFEYERMYKRAEQRALKTYFRNTPNITRTLQKWINDHPILGFPLDLRVPFVRIGFNLLQDIWDYSPHQVLSGFIKLAQAKNKNVLAQSELFLASENIAKGAIGTTLMITGIILSAIGFLNLDIDEDEFMGVTVSSGNWKAKVSDLAPTITPMLFGVALVNGLKSGDAKFAKTMSNMFNIIGDATILGTLDNLYRYGGDPSALITDIPSDITGQLVPVVLKSLVNAIYGDKVKKDYSNKWILAYQNIAEVIPVLRDTLPKRINPYTGEKESDTVLSNILNLVSPVKIVIPKISSVQNEALKYATTSGATGNFTINDKKYSLDGKEREQFSVQRAKYVNRELEILFKTNEYKKATDAERTSKIKGIYTKATEFAKVWYWTNKGGSYYTSNRLEYGQLNKYLDNIKYRTSVSGSKFK